MPFSHLILAAVFVACIAFPFDSLGETSNPVKGDIERALDRHVKDALFCFKAQNIDIESLDLRKPPTREQERLLNACMEERGWITVDPPGERGCP